MYTANLDRNRAAIHGVLLFAALMSVTAAFPSIPWPWSLALPVLGYGVIVLAVGPLRRSVPRLAIGRLYGWPLLSVAVLALVTTGVLLGFQAMMQPDLTDLAAKLPVAWIGNLLLAGVGFSIVNAALEELIFRGLLWEVIAAEWNAGTALGVTTLLFGIGHLHGYPPGPIGAVLSGLYGLLLGAIRWWTGGLGLATLCHVGADATIFCILAETGAFAPI